MKIIAIILAFVLLLGMFTAIFGSIGFDKVEDPNNETPDVNVDEPIEYIYDNGLVLTQNVKFEYDTTDGTVIYSRTVFTDFSVDEVIPWVLYSNHYQSVDSPVYNESTSTNNVEVFIPQYDNGVYEYSLNICWRGGMPALNNIYIKTEGYGNVIAISNLFGPLTFGEDFFGSNNDKYDLTVKLTFDYNTGYCRSELIGANNNVIDNILDISLVTKNSYDSNGNLMEVEGKPIQFRYEICRNEYVNVDMEYISFERMTFRKLTDDAYVLPENYFEDNSAEEIEGEVSLLTSDSYFYLGNTYNVDSDKTISSVYSCEDFGLGTDESTPFYQSELHYTGDGTGLYGNNLVDIRLPNYDTGTYIFRQSIDFYGSGEKFYPPYLNVYLKSPNALNTTSLFEIKEKFITLAEFFGYEFRTSFGGRMTIEYVFDFDNNVIDVNLYDLNGKSYSFKDISLNEYTGEYKSSPIILRYHLPEDKYEVNPNFSMLVFCSWSYDKVV